MNPEPVLVELDAGKVRNVAIMQPVPRPIRRVTVGFTVKPLDNLESLLPPPNTPFANDTGTEIANEATAQWIASEWARQKEAAKQCPHFSTFDKVYISTTPDDVGVFACEGRGLGTEKPSVCKAVREWLFKRFPHAWSPQEKWPDGHIPPRVEFIGFRSSEFRIRLMLECSLPENDCALPPDMWRAGASAGINEILEISPATMPLIVRRRMPQAPPEDVAVWTRHLDGWEGPGTNAEKDHYLALELALQLGFLLTE